MLNQSGITTTKGFNTDQILASTKLQYSIPIIVSSTGVQEVNGKKIVKAGTPLAGNLTARGTAFTVAKDSGEGTKTSDATVVLLHDVDVTHGNANGTGLVFGFVDLNKLAASVKTLLTDAAKKALTKITFIG